MRTGIKGAKPKSHEFIILFIIVLKNMHLILIFICTWWLVNDKIWDDACGDDYVWHIPMPRGTISTHSLCPTWNYPKWPFMRKHHVYIYKKIYLITFYLSFIFLYLHIYFFSILISYIYIILISFNFFLSISRIFTLNTYDFLVWNSIKIWIKIKLLKN